MALNDYNGEPVLGGTWMYDGTQPRRDLVIARNFDLEFARTEDERPYGIDNHCEGDPEDSPRPMGPDGRLYYIRGTSCPGLDTVAEAKAWADAQPWGPVIWDE